ncbi:pseudouridine synthase [Thiomicrorhabdus heinhorstiae]|uniref:Pseudouridine synthase n=1 Tax=Thiomicrorhabdus heinhorstiae TaxID=2748010 RepID=A0ABS0BV68_9GAMM|nr:pseudouridine synthase [Thiomicrorhabdus heinhorstiae]MBF6056721.1 rRNA pseudouridine synthase [Thiomicrorhabdus heinhorstiae]
MRINKFLSQSGVCSKRQADRLILAGEVTVNGKKAEVGLKVGDGDEIAVNGRLILGEPEMRVVLYHKPRGVVCTHDRSVEGNLPSQLPLDDKLMVVGRLDKDSEGLLLLTNQGEWVNRILQPSFEHPKRYRVWLERPICDASLAQMAAGVEILGQRTLPCPIHRLAENAFEIVLIQGLNRQIRRMVKSVGNRVERLIRVEIMHFSLGELEPGEWRNADFAEIAQLQESLQPDSAKCD